MATDQPLAASVPSAETDSGQDTGRVLILAALLLVASLWSYRNSFAAPFAFDDIHAIVEEPSLRWLWPLSQHLRHSRPVPQLSLAVNYAVGGLHVRGYHLVNFLVHLAAGLALFGLTRRTLLLPARQTASPLPAMWLAFAVALLWLVHPLQTESVTYVIQRHESMMGMFFLLCLYCLLRGSQAVIAWPWYLATIVSSWLGAGSKEVMVTAPVVMLLFDRVFLAKSWREIGQRRWWVYLGCATATAYLIYRALPAMQTSEKSTAGFGMTGITPWQYLGSQPGVILHYLRLTFWPHPLCLDYQWPVARTATEIFVPGTVIVTLLVASLLALRYRPWLGFLGLSFFIVLAPTSSIMPIADLAFEHRMYVPLAPVLVLAVLAFYGAAKFAIPDDRARRLARRLASSVALLLVAGALVLVTVDRNRDYCDELRMWTKACEVAPYNARAHFTLGAAYGRRKDYEQERRYYERAIKLDPNYPRPYGNLGALLAREGKTNEAIAHYRTAIKLDPDFVKAYINYANILARDGDYEGALVLYQKGLAANPREPVARQHMATTLWKLGRASEAVAMYRQALHLEPELANARMRLAWLLATAEDPKLRNGREALQLVEPLLTKLHEPDYRLHDTLAAAYAEVGLYEQAVLAAQKSVELAVQAADKMKPPSDQKTAVDEKKKLELDQDLAALRARLDLYRQRRPYRETLTAKTEHAKTEHAKTEPAQSEPVKDGA